MKTGFFPCPCAIITFPSLIIDGNSETWAVSFDPVLCILNGSSTEPFFVSFEVFFWEYFQQGFEVYQHLKNLSFLYLRSILKRKYLHRIYCVFLNNLVPGTWHLGILAQNKHNLHNEYLAFILPQSIHLNLQVLTKYCIYLLLQLGY